MTDCEVVWGTWARYHLVPILNTKPVAELMSPALYCGWCKIELVSGKTCPFCQGPLVSKP